MTDRFDRFSLLVGVVVLVLAAFATNGTLGEVINKGSLLTGLALGVAALAVAASTLHFPRVRRSVDSESARFERQNPDTSPDAAPFGPPAGDDADERQPGDEPAGDEPAGDEQAGDEIPVELGTSDD